jgi:hemoglobin
VVPGGRARPQWHHVQYDPRKVQTVYEAAGANEGLLRLARAWHARVMADEVVSHAFSHGFHPGHSERLAAYWAEALGGPTTFSAAYGDETPVVGIHNGNGPHNEMDRWTITCFDQALEDIGLADNDRLRQVLRDYFTWATTTTMSRYHRSPDSAGIQFPLTSAPVFANRRARRLLASRAVVSVGPTSAWP